MAVQKKVLLQLPKPTRVSTAAVADHLGMIVNKPPDLVAGPSAAVTSKSSDMEYEDITNPNTSVDESGEAEETDFDEDCSDEARAKLLIADYDARELQERDTTQETSLTPENIPRTQLDDFAEDVDMPGSTNSGQHVPDNSQDQPMSAVNISPSAIKRKAMEDKQLEETLPPL